MSRPIVEERCAAFEGELRKKNHPSIEVFLHGLEGEERLALLLELAMLDLEYRLTAGEEISAQHYAQTFPELQGRPETMNALREHEADVRNRPRPLLIADRYEVEQEIGRGGMAVVYRARDRQLARAVAVKMMQLQSFTAEQQAQLRSEGPTLAALRHPGIVEVYGTGPHGDTWYLAMELVPGGSLDRLLAGKPQPPQGSARLVRTLAEAIQAAHEKGIIHRDLKPANVLLSPSVKQSASQAVEEKDIPTARLNDSWTPKITDFGLARQLQTGRDATQTAHAAGTPAYMAPEQIGGQVSKSGDIWALGVILYECLTGRPPFLAESVFEIMQLILTNDPVPLRRLIPTVPRDLETICLKCLHKEPGKRYLSARELADDLQRYLDGLPIQARPVSSFERAARWARRRPALAGLGAFSVLALAAVVVVLLWSNLTVRRARDNEKQANEELRQSNLALKEKSNEATEAADSAVKVASTLASSIEENIAPIISSKPEEMIAALSRAIPPLVRLKSTPESELILASILNARALLLLQINQTTNAERDIVRSLDLVDGRKSPPTSARIIATHARALYILGQIQEDRGQLPEAEKSYRECARRYESLAELQPDTVDWQMLRARAINAAGNMLAMQGKTKASFSFAHASGIRRKVAASGKQLKPEWRRDVAISIEKQADDEYYRNLDKAIKGYAEAIKVYRALYEENPADGDVAECLARACTSMGQAVFEAGNVAADDKRRAEMRKWYLEAKSLTDQLTKRVIVRNTWLREGFRVNLLLITDDINNAKTDQELRDYYRAALPRWTEALKIVERKQRENPVSIKWQMSLAGLTSILHMYHLSLARAALRQKDATGATKEWDAAWGYIARTVATYDGLAKIAPTCVDWRRLQITSRLNAADVRVGQGKFKEARELLAEAIRLCKKWDHPQAKGLLQAVEAKMKAIEGSK